MDEVDPREELLASVARELDEVIPKVEAVDWEKRKPTAQHLVLLAEYYRLLLSEAWAKDIEYRFQLERITSTTGLSEHDINLFVEIGGWIATDRRLQSLPESEVEKFWGVINDLDSSIDMDAVTQGAKKAQADRAQEIAELNKLFEAE